MSIGFSPFRISHSQVRLVEVPRVCPILNQSKNIVLQNLKDLSQFNFQFRAMDEIPEGSFEAYTELMQESIVNMRDYQSKMHVYDRGFYRGKIFVSSSDNYERISNQYNRIFEEHSQRFKEYLMHRDTFRKSRP